MAGPVRNGMKGPTGDYAIDLANGWIQLRDSPAVAGAPQDGVFRSVSVGPNTPNANPGQVHATSLLVDQGVVFTQGSEVSTYGPANGVDDTAGLNAHLLARAGGTVILTQGSNYKISSSLVIYTGTLLDLNNATITLLPGSSCNMIHNHAWVVGSGRDNNITLQGGTLDAGSNGGGAGQQLHQVLFQRVDQPVLVNMILKNTAGKYAIMMYACTDYLVDQITFNTSSDGVHCSGASAGAKISNIWGTCGDDVVALTPIDWLAYQNGDFGNMTDFEITGIYASTTN